MSEPTVSLVGELEGREIVDAIGEIYSQKLTGTLGIEAASARQQLHFGDGELFLDEAHPFSGPLGEALSQKAQKPGEETIRTRTRSQLERVSSDLVELLLNLKGGGFRFEPNSGPPSGSVGPLPTVYLVMEGAVQRRTQDELLEQLGGEGGRVVASGDFDVLKQLHGLDPEKMFLLSRAESPITISELLRQVSIDRLPALRKLCRIHSIGLLKVLEESSSGSTADELVNSLVERFSSRFRERLRTEPLALSDARHREEIAELMGNVGTANHYELLGVGLTASDEEVHDAFERLARLVHPCHATRLGLTDRDAGLHVLFERATVAYVTLTDAERRVAYNQTAGIEATKLQSEGQRDEEQRRVARESYEKAVTRVEHEDFHFALELVGQAIMADPQAEYYALQGMIEARNPHWLARASESYRHALRLDPDNADYRTSLGRVMEELGDLDSARVHYKVAIKRSPRHGEALAGLQRVGAAERSESTLIPKPVEGTAAAAKGGGLFAKLKQLFSG